ncbi:MAG: DUF6788 family protein [Egibacteraceae bacterium]
MDRKRLDSLETRIQKIKEEIATLDELRPGSLSRQYNVCGNPDCRCKANPPSKHGPYYQLSFTRQGKSTSQFVRHEDLPAVTRQLQNYRRLRQLVDAWIELGMELSRLKLQKPESKKPPGIAISKQK